MAQLTLHNRLEPSKTLLKLSTPTIHKTVHTIARVKIRFLFVGAASRTPSLRDLGALIRISLPWSRDVNFYV